MKRPYVVFGTIAFVAIIAGPILARRAQRGINRVDPGTGVVEATGDPELAAAVMRAKKELPLFIAALVRNPEGEFAVNARFLTRNGPEQLWVKVTGHDHKTFHGVIASKPLSLDKKVGDAVDVSENNVSDWTFRVDGKTEGGFTSAVLRRRSALP